MLNFEPWFENHITDDSPFVSSRVRLARNIEGYPFHGKLGKDEAFSILQDVETAIGRLNNRRPYDPLVAQDLHNSDEERLFLEKHILSPKYLDNKLAKGVFVDMHQNTSIMVNEEDHIRIQSVFPGDNLGGAFSTSNAIDNLLERYLNFSFDENLGYLTACPTNVGTGIRASVMLHLPCLTHANALRSLFPGIAKAGMTLRGIYGEGTIPMGSMYQLSNQITLGINESEVLKKLKKVADDLLKNEKEAMDKILETRPHYLQDKAYRAYGILAYSRKLDIHEAMGFLSDIRLGYYAGFLKLPKPDLPIYQIMMEIQPGHLYFSPDFVTDFMPEAQEKIEEQDLNIARSNYLRTIFTH